MAGLPHKYASYVLVHPRSAPGTEVHGTSDSGCELRTRISPEPTGEQEVNTRGEREGEIRENALLFEFDEGRMKRRRGDPALDSTSLQFSHIRAVPILGKDCGATRNIGELATTGARPSSQHGPGHELYEGEQRRDERCGICRLAHPGDDDKAAPGDIKHKNVIAQHALVR